MDSLETEEDMRNFLQFAYDMDEEVIGSFGVEYIVIMFHRPLLR